MRTFLILMLLTIMINQVNDYARLREKMVKEQIESRGIKDPLVLQAMRKVERHLFVPDEYKKYAYHDSPLPIGHKQTISQPYIVAFMTEVLQLNKNMKVLEIGTGSGYQTAILAEIVKEIYTIELLEPLYSGAKKILDQLGYTNIQFKHGDGYKGWEEHAPFDAIIVTAAAEDIPAALVKQLKNNGRMIIPVGETHSDQYLILLEKKNEKIEKKYLLPVRFVPLIKTEP